MLRKLQDTSGRLHSQGQRVRLIERSIHDSGKHFEEHRGLRQVRQCTPLLERQVLLGEGACDYKDDYKGHAIKYRKLGRYFMEWRAISYFL